MSLNDKPGLLIRLGVLPFDFSDYTRAKDAVASVFSVVVQLEAKHSSSD